ncbi:hypothetical protein JYT27_00310, partial [bacterium AH-315-D21]|nr:hypothetical protein [bacterium AH-315-D21]
SFLYGVAWRSGVKVTSAQLLSPERLALNVSACNADPEISMLRETDVDVQVRVVASSFLFRGGGDDCGGIIEVKLQEPLGDRILIDRHTRQTVKVRPVNPSSSADHAKDEGLTMPDVAPQEINDPPNEAELQDLQNIANQKGISLQEAIDRYAWNDNFSLLIAKIRSDFPAAYAGSAIIDTGGAWVAFAGPAPEEALDIIDLFSSIHSGVLVEVRAGTEFTEAELQKAIPAAHYAVLGSPKVREAVTSFDYATGRITTTVVLESTAPDSVLDDLRAVAEKAIIDATVADILDSITYFVVRSNNESLGRLE